MQETQTKIISTYKKVSGFFFHYLIFFVVLGVALLIFQNIISQSSNINVFQTNTTLLMQKAKVIGEFNKFLKQDINNNDLKIQILQGDLQVTQGFITSVNNLISYKGFIIPKYFYMYNTLPIQQISYFSGGNYDPAELENVINALVFTKKITVNKPFTRVQLPLAKTLMDDFNLSCLSQTKLSSRTCNYYLNDFLDSFFIYNISLDYPGLKNVFNAIKGNTTDKTRFCDTLGKYLLYANDHNNPIKELFGLCGPTYEDIFRQTTLFLEIQNSLDTQNFTHTSYKDFSLNEYKLLSYQQQIYQDFFINITDSYKITNYLDFAKEILMKNTIDPLYKDEIYRYNIKYLQPSLEKFAYQSTSSTQNLGATKIAAVLTYINTLNEGDPMLGFTGLNQDIMNKNLIVQEIAATGNNINIISSKTEIIQKKLQNSSYLVIDKQNITGTTVDIIGYLNFFSPNNNQNIKAHIIMDYTNDMLVVKSIELQGKPEINDVIKNLLLIQSFSIGELYSYISKNLVFYEQQNIPVTTAIDLCPTLSKLQNISIVSCSNDKVILTKTTNNQITTYTFTIKNGGIGNINISDIPLETSIKSSYNSIVANTYNLTDTIQALLDYTPPPQGHEGTTNAIVVFEKIQQYLGIKTNDIADNSGKILVDITLGAINFIAQYTLSTNTLGPWYFKDILANGKPYPIQNLNLVLDDAHQNNINSFVINPLGAIQTADLTARQNYRASQIKN